MSFLLSSRFPLFHVCHIPYPIDQQHIALMGRPKLTTIFTSKDHQRLPSSSDPTRQNLVEDKSDAPNDGFPSFFFGFLRRLMSGSKWFFWVSVLSFFFGTMVFVCYVLVLMSLWNFVDKIDGGSRTEAEEKVYSWLYALAQSDKDLVFEYVRSTERGENLVFIS